MYKDHDKRVFARTRSYIDKWKPSISELHVKTKNTNIFVSWFTFLPMGDVDTHAPTRLSFQHAFNRDTCNFTGGLMQLLFNLSLLLERFNDPFCWNFEVLFAFMQNYVLRTITCSLCISFWHLSLSLSLSLSLFYSRSYIPILCYKKISCNVQSKPGQGATYFLWHYLGLII